MILRKIAKAAYDALPDVMKAEYKVSATNAAEYLLDTDEATELLSARDREKARADALQAQIDKAASDLAAATAEAEEAKAKAAREKGDVKGIEATWQAKLDALTADHAKALEKLNLQLRGLLVSKEAQRIANEISTTPDLIEHLIEKRLQANLDGETPTTMVLGADGKPSAMTLVELQQEFVANPKFKAIIKASGASGGSAGTGGSGGGSATKKLSEMNEQERVTLARDNPAEWTRVLTEDRAARSNSRLR